MKIGRAMHYIRIADTKKANFKDFLEKLWISVKGRRPVDTGDQEYVSWKESLPKLIQVVRDAGLEQIILAAECELPTGGRIDAVLLGYSALDRKPLAVLVELKQWSRSGIELYGDGYTVLRVRSSRENYFSIHPVRQTDGYVKYLERNHCGAAEGRLLVSACQYLFNYEAAEKEYLFSGDFKMYRACSRQMFCKGEEGRFRDYLRHLFAREASGDPEVLSLFLDSGYRISDLDLEAFRNIINQPENISMVEDQVQITECINMALEKLLCGDLDKKYMFLITGAAGTGKTIAGFKILSDYCRRYQEIYRRSDYKCAYTLPRSRTIKAVLDGIGGGLQVVFLNNLKGPFDLLVVDEGHRVTDFDRRSGGVGRALSSAKLVVILQDDRQRVLGNEKGTVANYRTFAEENGFVFQTFRLRLQKRAGFGGYVDRIDQLLYGGERGGSKNNSIKENRGQGNGIKENGIRIRVCSTLSELEALVNKTYQADKSIKYYAPYCWKWKSRNSRTAMDLVIPDGGHIFQKQWNPYLPDEQYRWYLDSVEQAGCIYTAQGLGYDYVAFLWWDDLKWDKRCARWIVDFNKVTPYDTLLKQTLSRNGDYDYIMLNIYRVLLTRAKKGIYIWFRDPDTREHFREVVLEDRQGN